jgi:protoporphyrinogen oxidase
MNRSVVIVGAGPAGLTAACELTRRGVQPLVLEQADKVGGIARTEVYQGYRFDIGGHRFFSRNEEVRQLWQQMLGADLLRVSRLSRICYDGRFLNYPLEFFNALSNLGVVESTMIVLSYLNARLSPYRDERTFEHWVTNRLGRRLFEGFFRPYTEKVWGIPCHEIEADWAAQRITGLSLRAALSNALFGTGDADTLISEFQYPVLGPGMMWERFKEVVESHGAEVHLNTRVSSFGLEGRHVRNLIAQRDEEMIEVRAGHYISSMPVKDLISQLDPPPPEDVVRAAQRLKYRAFVIVGLIVDRADLFPDNWIYVHDPDLKVGRIQNFKNWSAAMVADLTKTSLGLEYFCDEADEVWTMPDAELIELASAELAHLGLADADLVVDGVVFRQPKAYPVYNRGYRKNVDTIRRFLDTVDNLQTIGRSGTHRYNNMDHSMLGGLTAARNLAGQAYHVGT